MNGPILTYPILREPRRYSDYIAWIDATMAAICMTPEARAEARLADGPVKIFREEVLSFRPVAEFLYADTRALVRFPADNGPRDVLVAEVGQGAERPFEIVTAGDGYDMRLRMELLSSEGHAPAFGPIGKVGSNKRTNYQVVAEGTAVEHRRLIEQTCEHVVVAIHRKRRRRYSADVWLVAHFDGSVVREPDVAQIVETATEAAVTTTFTHVFLTATIAGKAFCRQIK